MIRIRRVVTCRAGMFSLALKMLAVCAVLFGACLQLTGQGGQQVATIRRITVSGDHHDPGVEIIATAPITPLIQTATDPDRLIIDIPEALPSSGLQKIRVNGGKVRDIRVRLLSANPPITRVVLDLVGRAAQYAVSPLGNRIVIKIGNESSKSDSESDSASARIAPPTTLPVDARRVETTSVVAAPPPDQPTAPSRARWILPILFMVTVVAMLVIALVAHIQNKRARRGL